MKTSIRLLPRCLFMLLLSCTGQAIASTEIVPGVVYPGGTTLASSALGIEFDVPQDWKAVLPPGAEVMIMEPNNAVARMIISVVPGSSEAALLALMNRKQTLDAGSRLVATGEAVKKGKYYHQQYRYEGHNPQNLAAEAFAALGDNQTAFYLVTLEPEGGARFTELAKNLVASVRFRIPGMQTHQQADDASIDWEQRLSGRTLKYMRTSDGMSTSRILNLCSNHGFSYSESDNYVSSDAYTDFSASSHSGKHGRWYIEANQLVLLWSDGSRSTYTLSQRYVEEWDEWGIFVDDERWFNVANKACY